VKNPPLQQGRLFREPVEESKLLRKSMPSRTISVGETTTTTTKICKNRFNRNSSTVNLFKLSHNDELKPSLNLKPIETTSSRSLSKILLPKGNNLDSTVNRTQLINH
jgi:hypothetical protein